MTLGERIFYAWCTLRLPAIDRKMRIYRKTGHTYEHPLAKLIATAQSTKETAPEALGNYQALRPNRTLDAALPRTHPFWIDYFSFWDSPITPAPLTPHWPQYYFFLLLDQSWMQLPTHLYKAVARSIHACTFEIYAGPPVFCVRLVLLWALCVQNVHHTPELIRFIRLLEHTLSGHLQHQEVDSSGYAPRSLLGDLPQAHGGLPNDAKLALIALATGLWKLSKSSTESLSVASRAQELLHASGAFGISATPATGTFTPSVRTPAFNFFLHSNELLRLGALGSHWRNETYSAGVEICSMEAPSFCDYLLLHMGYARTQRVVNAAMQTLTEAPYYLRSLSLGLDQPERASALLFQIQTLKSGVERSEINGILDEDRILSTEHPAAIAFRL